MAIPCRHSLRPTQFVHAWMGWLSRILGGSRSLSRKSRTSFRDRNTCPSVRISLVENQLAQFPIFGGTLNVIGKVGEVAKRSSPSGKNLGYCIAHLHRLMPTVAAVATHGRSKYGNVIRERIPHHPGLNSLCIILYCFRAIDFVGRDVVDLGLKGCSSSLGRSKGFGRLLQPRL